jgi:phosphoglycerate dehydrogenase-like enzyme
VDRPHGTRPARGGGALSGSQQLVVLGTPLFGGPLPPEAIARVESVAGTRFVQLNRDGRVRDAAADTEDDLLAAARVLFRGGMPAATLDHVVGRAPQLEWIHSYSAGVERVATPVVRSRGLTVTNGRGVFSRPIAEYLVMMLLAVERRLPQLLELQGERSWQPLPGRELAGVTVGIVGFGSIGAEVARLLEPFGTRIIATRRHPERGAGEHTNVELLGLDALDELLAASDAVFVTAPLTDATAGLIGAHELQEMREGAWLFNIARGRLVDEVALRRALDAGWIGGAVLDVFTEEPLPADSPFYDTPNVIITPHTSWASDRVLERSLDLFVANLEHFVAGEPLANVVDLEAGY